MALAIVLEYKEFVFGSFRFEMLEADVLGGHVHRSLGCLHFRELENVSSLCMSP